MKDRKHLKVVKPWGYEECFENNELYCGKLITVGDRWSSNGRFHFHVRKDETFFVIADVLRLDIITNYSEVMAVAREFRADNRFNIVGIILYPGMSFRIEPGIPHRFKSGSIGLAKFIEASTHSSEEDNYYVDSVDLMLADIPD